MSVPLSRNLMVAGDAESTFKVASLEALLPKISFHKSVISMLSLAPRGARSRWQSQWM